MQDSDSNSPPRVLIVDADRDCAEIFAEHLMAHGFEIAVAAPEEMFETLKVFDASIVLCDIEGEGAAGANLPGQLLEERPDLLCVAMARRADMRQGGEFIDKSKGVDCLVPTIEGCFKKREMWRIANGGVEILRHAERATKEASRVKVEFLAKISHELRTPLNAIIGFSELMMHDPRGLANEQYQTYISDIHTSGRHLLDIINDILDFAKAEAGQLALFESNVDVQQVVHAIERLLAPRARDTGIEFKNSIPADLPLVWCDERKLKQMLLNLVNNAVKFTPSGGAIEIGARLDPEGFILAVRDNGIGIAEADLDRVLEPFVQAETTLSRRQEGTGLGLALVKAMIEIHGGRLRLESQLGKGTSAELVFPAERISAAREDHEHSPERQQKRRASNASGRRSQAS
jgi:signal transduction histidine kinase